MTQSRKPPLQVTQAHRELGSNRDDEAGIFLPGKSRCLWNGKLIVILHFYSLP